MLTLDGVRLSHGDFNLTADWSVNVGERIGVIGPSGGGKSTLLHLIAGFERPDRGQVLWQGQDLGSQSPGQRPVTILFQDQNLFPHLTLAQNLGLGLSPDLRLTAQDHHRIAGALERIGLGGLAARKPGSLSGGQQARAALARALLRARPILLLDEPFSALGPAMRTEMLDLVQEVARETGALVLMVSHDPRDIRRFADRAVLVDGGIAHAPQEVAAFFDQPSPALRAYLGE
jgi:thiamine transport system ATP-binding protein